MAHSPTPMALAATRPPCCYTTAMDMTESFCTDCGDPLIRCIAFEECGGLLGDDGLCTVCIAPTIQIAAVATLDAKIGEKIALPILIENISSVGRPLFVTSLWSREAKGEWHKQDLPWDQLKIGKARPATLLANALKDAGVHPIEILITVSSRWRWREECFAFSTNFTLNVADDKQEASPTVNIGGTSAGHGNTVYIAGNKEKSSQKNVSEADYLLALNRAEIDERRLGLRGHSETGFSIPRQTQIHWRGFMENQTPNIGPILTPDGILAIGRSKPLSQNGLGDVRLLATKANGEIDPDISRMISRRHFELYIECDRLMLRVTSNNGLRINGEAYGAGKTVCLNDKDEISPLIASPEALRLSVHFQIEHGRVNQVTMTRSTAP